METIIYIFLGIVLVWMISKPKAATSKNIKTDNDYEKSINKIIREENISYAEKNQQKQSIMDLFKREEWRQLIDKFNTLKDKSQFYDYNILQLTAVAHFKIGDIKESESFFNQAILSDPYMSPLIHVNAAIMFRDAEMYQEALEWIQKMDLVTLRKSGNTTEYYRALRIGSECFRKLGLTDENISFLKQAPLTARIIDKDLADIFYLIAELYEEKGEYMKALKSYQKYVTVKYDKEVNRRISDLNQIIYEAEQEKDLLKQKSKNKKLGL